MPTKETYHRIKGTSVNTLPHDCVKHKNFKFFVKQKLLFCHGHNIRY